MTLRLILPMIPHLPEDVFTMDPPLELVFSIHDAPSGLVSHSFRSQSESLAAQGQSECALDCRFSLVLMLFSLV